VSRAASAAGSATYLYALVRRARPPAARGAPTGLPGLGPARALGVGPGLWLIAADAPRDAYSEAAIDRGLKDMAWVSGCALAHEAVVEHFAGAGPMLPMKLFTLFASDERARQHVRRRQQALTKALDKVAGRSEWGVRVSGDGRAPAAATRPAPGPRSGTQFLMAKKAQREEASQQAERAGAAAEGLFQALAEHADGATRRPIVVPAAGTRLWLDAAFLVARGRSRSFQAALKREAQRLARLGFRVTLTGPWPPYNFVGPIS
jgi:hypothetical protein